jgi:5-methylcytosine-specific restriction enzyme subunit McrC
MLDTPAAAAEKIPVKNAWYLLLYAWDMAQWRGKWPGASESSPGLLGLLARILIEATRDLLKKQLGRAHAQRRAAVNGIRGRVEFGESLKHLSFERGQTHCSYPELSVDTLKNRILRSTLHRLAADSRATHTDSEKAARLRHDLREVVRAMEGVQVVPISSADFSRLQIGRNDRDYALPMMICALVRRLEMPTESGGDRGLPALLRNEIVFHDLFERFVRNFYRLHLSEHEVKRETLEWHDDLGCSRVPTMRTDITLVGKLPPHQRMIIDTKYSVQTLAAAPYGVPKFKSENLYQLYAYLRTQEHRSDAHREAAGMLLYPTTAGDVDESMRVQGHIIRVATLDLSLDWKSIESRLLDLVEPHPHPLVGTSEDTVQAAAI